MQSIILLLDQVFLRRNLYHTLVGLWLKLPYTIQPIHEGARKILPIDELLFRSAQLEEELHAFLSLKTYDDSPRYISSRTMCSLTFEHSESIKILTASGNLTSAFGLFRLQYEALVRAMWLFYAASDIAISKMVAELSHEAAKRAEKLPMLSEMLVKLEGKAPTEALAMLLEFKEYSWKPLSSFIHGGIHAFSRHGEGYPQPLIENLVKQSNGVSIMVGTLLVILHGGVAQMGKIPEIQVKFSDCLPDPKRDTP